MGGLAPDDYETGSAMEIAIGKRLLRSIFQSVGQLGGKNDEGNRDMHRAEERTMLGEVNTYGVDFTASAAKAKLDHLRWKQAVFALLAEIDEALQLPISPVHASTVNHAIKLDQPASIRDPSHRTENSTSDPSSTTVVESVADSNIGNPSHELGPLGRLEKEAVASISVVEIHGTDSHPEAGYSYLFASTSDYVESIFDVELELVGGSSFSDDESTDSCSTKISSRVSDPFDVAGSSTFKLHSPFTPIRIQDGRPASDDEEHDTTLDGLQGPEPLAMVTGVDNEEISVQDEFMALKPDMVTILRSNIMMGDGKCILDGECRSVSRMSFLENDCKSDLSSVAVDESVLGEDHLLPLAKDDGLVAMQNEQPKGMEGLPSPGTFFAALRTAIAKPQRPNCVRHIRDIKVTKPRVPIASPLFASPSSVPLHTEVMGSSTIVNERKAGLRWGASELLNVLDGYASSESFACNTVGSLSFNYMTYRECAVQIPHSLIFL
ncbi:hypothetical protein SeLEV6574_g05133 [Synchytrium endobioticum]|uniref:Uncharacterized protein n=1 Tax=Synchytrium endobioticum TaxID=286115 RepID=A0A507CW28_9FUNG|nr:hypothetical protein SeLEV6574_g05133 [Synchytrium endobioticum]